MKNRLDAMACDLENVYLNAPCMEKIWFEGGLECGSDKGKVCVVVCALYSLKSAGASCITEARFFILIKFYLKSIEFSLFSVLEC
jgi:hypothetical protein